MSGAKHKGTILVMSQVYPPDPTSVGQHVADTCVELVQRGYRVVVVTANRGYDDPSKKYASRELRDGVDVRRVPFSSFGKASVPVRAAAMLAFIAWCIWYGFFTRGAKAVLVSTAPPLCGLAAGLVRIIRRVPYVYWVMDVNPDQLIALGKAKESALSVRVSDRIQRFVLKHAHSVVVLDRFMADRMNRKLDVTAKMANMPPWPHEEPEAPLAHADNNFRKEHKLDDKFVVMYSGNHGFATPVDTMLKAAEALEDEPRIQFMFVGGGVRKKEIDAALQERARPNVRSLPYQPMETLRHSLSAADLHLVAMEARVVGINHPCKIYGAMAVGRPILLLGPNPCHASDILAESEVSFGAAVEPDDAEGMVREIRRISALGADELARMGATASSLIAGKYSKSSLRGRFCDIIEAAATRAELPERERHAGARVESASA
ncbi:MAG: glycosyltransferase family 4 protein [Phycisphaerales bacterium]|nr:glycosyltransferase family 4 protein [Phycisphaerales bacterium]